jgi:dTDP-4-dehydrorhamnose reductase
MKTLILGARGMLGTDLAQAFKQENPILFDKGDLDITDEAAVAAAFSKAQPELVINAAAYTDVEGAEDNAELANRVNGLAVGALARQAAACGATLVHYSTDYVFGGDKEDGYNENNTPAEKPLNVYGASKLLGETELAQNTGQFYLIRTSWLYGINGKNFVETMVRLAQERDELKVINDQHGKPTFTADLAQATRELVSGDYSHGVYHLVNEGATTWYDFASEIIQRFGAQQRWPKEKFPRMTPVTSEEFPTKAVRSHWSILNNTKFPPLRSWKGALGNYIASREQRK